MYQGSELFIEVADEYESLKSFESGNQQMDDNSVMAGIEEAMDDIRHGRVTEYESADDMFEKLGMSYYARLAVDMETI